MFQVYGMSLSGNCHKIRQLLHWLDLDYQWHEIDIFNGGTQTSEFLSINPNGKVPVFSLENGEQLPESNAALYYLARDSQYFPRQKLAQARVLQWMFFEQYSHEPAIAVARFIKTFLPADHSRQAELPSLIEKSNKALAVMESHLQNHRWFVDDRVSIADIALYAYTHVADQGGISLQPFPAIMNWLERYQALHNYIPMQAP